MFHDIVDVCHSKRKRRVLEVAMVVLLAAPVAVVNAASTAGPVFPWTPVTCQGNFPTPNCKAGCCKKTANNFYTVVCLELQCPSGYVILSVARLPAP